MQKGERLRCECGATYEVIEPCTCGDKQEMICVCGMPLKAEQAAR